jgi:hypothetical protein
MARKVWKEIRKSHRILVGQTLRERKLLGEESVVPSWFTWEWNPKMIPEK